MWRDLVGPQVAHVARRGPLLAHGVLRIFVLDPRWAADLRAMEPTILAKVQTAWGEAIQGIEWVRRRTPRGARCL